MKWISDLTSMLLPLLFAGIGLFFLCKQKSFDAFADGAATGLRQTAQLLPVFLMLVCGVSMLRTCGLLSCIERWLAPITTALDLPVQLIPLLLLRPISGSASIAQLNEIFESCGVDSPAGSLGSVILGSSETVFYVVTVYFGAVGIRKCRYAIFSALCVMLLNLFFAVLFCRIFA